MFFTRERRRNSASFGAANLERKWPGKSVWRISAPESSFGTSIRCAARPAWAKASRPDRIGGGRGGPNPRRARYCGVCSKNPAENNKKTGVTHKSSGNSCKNLPNQRLSGQKLQVSSRALAVDLFPEGRFAMGFSGNNLPSPRQA